jgi:lysophospholipase L1-like esterase
MRLAFALIALMATCLAPAAQAQAGAKAAVFPSWVPPAEAHAGFLKIAKAGNIDLLFLGDSITRNWLHPDLGLAEWTKTFVPLKAANFGVAGEMWQGLLWRVRNGELEGFHARLVVVLIGANNVANDRPASIAAGEAAILAEIRKRQPQAKVLLLGVLPEGAQANNPMREKVRALNQRLAPLADNTHIFYLDMGDKFIGRDGAIPGWMMFDGLHPNHEGYRVWSEAIAGKIGELMK